MKGHSYLQERAAWEKVRICLWDKNEKKALCEGKIDVTMKTFAVMLLTDVGRCEYFFLLFFNLNSCCFPYSASNVLAFLVLVLHGILTEEMLCAPSHFYAAVPMFVTLWNAFLAPCQAWVEEGKKTPFWRMRVSTSAGAGKHGHGTFFATLFCEFVNKMWYLIKATTKPFNLHN